MNPELKKKGGAKKKMMGGKKMYESGGFLETPIQTLFED